jgi:ABC-type molybdate transport system substrate-binding protein
MYKFEEICPFDQTPPLNAGRSFFAAGFARCLRAMHWRIAQVAAIGILSMMGTNSHASGTVILHAAGSLRGALTDLSNAYEKLTGVKVVPKWGPSGLLRDEIAKGAKADVFASANMEHPEQLAKAGKAGPVMRFARNTICALVRPGLDVTSTTLLARMLDPEVRLGTSTPKADPSGDYAFEVFRKAESLQAGANAALVAKALQLTGGPNSPAPPADRSLYGALVAAGQADIFLVYCTAAMVAQRENPGQRMIALPAELAVGADYGLTVIEGSSVAAKDFAAFILSPQGQRILLDHGFVGAN